MHHTIEYCVGNVDPDTRERLRSLDHTTIEKPCLQRCGSCFRGPLLVIDGEAVVGESYDDLLRGVAGSNECCATTGILHGR